MAFAQGSRSGLSIQAETVYGVAPAIPTLIQLPYASHTLNLTKDRVQGNDIQPDRMPRVDRHGNRKVSGDIVVDLKSEKDKITDFLDTLGFESSHSGFSKFSEFEEGFERQSARFNWILFALQVAREEGV